MHSANDHLQCDPRRLHGFLDQQLSAGEESELEAHLDHCPDCREKLNDWAVEPQWWTSASQYLRADVWDELLDVDAACASGTVAARLERTPNELIIRQLRQWFDPTDDPQYIGRFGGYEILGIIGHGGMGVVLKGYEPSLNRYVAIKVLAPSLATNGAARKRFSREARATAAVLHENVIAIHRVADADDLPYLVMPYINGVTLQKRTDEEGSLSLVAILRISRQVAAGLAAAHAQGLVHRDIKPANVLLERGVERVTITDFGLARTVDDASLTRTGVIAGTPHYMSPEQSRGESIDARSDLFSLGSVMYAMCTGHPPFRAETGYGILRRITDSQPRSIREINPEIPNWCEAIIRKLQAKQPSDRFQSAEELAELLEECLMHVQQPAVAPLPAQVRKLTDHMSENDAPVRAGAIQNASHRPSWIVFAMIILFAASVATISVSQWYQRRAELPIPVVQPETGSRGEDSQEGSPSSIEPGAFAPPVQSDTARDINSRSGEAAQEPSLPELIRKMAAHEQVYLPYDIRAKETFRFPDDLTARERGSNLRSDGRKHQRLMEYAQLAPSVWRSSETILVDDQLEQGPYVKYSDGERIVQISPASIAVGTQSKQEVHITNDPRGLFALLHARPLYGIFSLSAYGDSKLFSEVFSTNTDAVDLTWDNGDAKLSFAYGHPDVKQRYLLWLSRAHDWHPVRLQRFWNVEDEEFHDEWEVTRFVRRGNVWRVAEGTHRYRDRTSQESPHRRISYSLDFVILEEKYGADVDEERFQYEIPAGATVHEDGISSVDRRSTPREITLTITDTDDRPIPDASIRFENRQLREPGSTTTDQQGVARIAEAPKGNVTMHIAAAGFRPATWVLGNVNQLRAVLVPVTPGVVLDNGIPAEDVWISNEPIQVRPDGLTHVPRPEWDGRDQHWSDAEGRFVLQTSLTLRQRDSMVPIIAVHPSLEKMAIRVVPAQELGQQQNLHLQRTCRVHGHCLLEGVSEFAEVDAGLVTSGGQYLGLVVTRSESTPEGLKVEYQMRLPPGDYAIQGRASSNLSTFKLPFSISPGQDELDMEITTVPATGAIALRGQQAPELDVQWRRGQEESWDSLRGNVVVLDFWGTWCGPCVGDMPLLMDIADQFQDRPVRWIAIHTPNLTTFDDLDRQLLLHQAESWNSRELPFVTVLDQPLDGEKFTGRTSHGFGIAAWPTLVVVDQQGQVVGPTSKNQLAETISRLLDQNQ